MKRSLLRRNLPNLLKEEGLERILFQETSKELKASKITYKK